jgi:hypothetical protein
MERRRSAIISGRSSKGIVFGHPTYAPTPHNFDGQYVESKAKPIPWKAEWRELAQGQALAVLEGTATPYAHALMAGPGVVKGLKAKDPGAGRKGELARIMWEIARDWGIALDAEVTRAPGNTHALVGRFTPRGLTVHNNQGRNHIAGGTALRSRAKQRGDSSPRQGALRGSGGGHQGALHHGLRY